MKKNTLQFTTILFWALGLFMIPLVSFADEPSAITSLIDFLYRTMTVLFPILTAFGMMIVGYNIIKYLSAQDQKDQTMYKSGIWSSLIALLLMFTIVAVIRVLAGTLGITGLGVDITTADPAGVTNGTSAGLSTIRNIALGISRFASDRLIPLMIGSALLFFLGNVVISMTHSDEEKGRTMMNVYLRNGILALFVLLTFFSIVSIFTGSFFGVGAVIPQFQTSE